MCETTLINLRTYHGTDYVLIDRRTIFGNPFKIGPNCTREEAVERYTGWFCARMGDPGFRVRVEGLRGKRLACWCTPLPCHGDVIIKYLER